MAPLENVEMFFRQMHLLLILVQALCWIDLLRFRHMPTPRALEIVLQEIRRRIFACLDEFIPHQSCPEFFRALKDCRGLLTGAVVREILLLNHENDPGTQVDDGEAAEDEGNGRPPARTLTLIVDDGDTTALLQCLTDVGYTRAEWDTRLRWVDTRRGLEVVREVQRYRRVAQSGEEHLIALIISWRGPLSVLLAADNTADMVAISHDTIVSYFPRLTFANEGLFVNTTVTGDSPIITIYEDGVPLLSDNQEWGKACGPYCPAIWRTTYDDEGMLKVHWDGTMEQKEIVQDGGTNEGKDERGC